MRVIVTGEKGFIAANLPKSLIKHDIEFVNLNNDGRIAYPAKVNGNDEMCVHRNNEKAWALAFDTLKIDMVIHNAAVVGTDVVALSPSEATLSNITGTHNIVQAANKVNIPVVYIGTTVIYDTKIYQDGLIYENSRTGPTTFYGNLKLWAEQYVREHAKKWIVLRPLFAYGGAGDMNSLMAKTFYSSLIPKKIDMFLDPTKYKDYLHVEDFCDAVALACKMKLYGNDYNIAAETPLVTDKIVDLMSEISEKDLKSLINWKPETDYLGNHRLSTAKFRGDTEWVPKISLEDGLHKSWDSILQNFETSTYNPLVYLDKAKNKGVDLTKFY